MPRTQPEKPPWTKTSTGWTLDAGMFTAAVCKDERAGTWRWLIARGTLTLAFDAAPSEEAAKAEAERCVEYLTRP